MSKLEVVATFGMKSDRLDKVLLNNVMVNGDVFRDHTWVEFKRGMGEFEEGDTMRFTASYHTFIGLNENAEYVPKKGFKNIFNIRKL